MEIKIVLEASPSFEVLIDKLVSAISAVVTTEKQAVVTTTKPAATVANPVVTTTKPVVTTTKPVATVTKPVATAVKSSEQPEQPEQENTEQESTEISSVSLSDLRILLRQKMNVGDNREAIRQKLTSLGANNLTTLEVHHYTEVAEFLHSL